MKTGVEDIPELQEFFSAAGWARALSSLAVAAMAFRIAPPPDAGFADPLVLAIFCLGVFSAAWTIAAKWRGKSRAALSFLGAVTLGVSLALLWKNDPLFSMRVLSAAYALFAVLHIAMLLSPGASGEPGERRRFVRRHRGGLAVLLTGLAINEAAIALGGGWVWIASYALRVLAYRAAILLAARS